VGEYERPWRLNISRSPVKDMAADEMKRMEEEAKKNMEEDTASKGKKGTKRREVSVAERPNSKTSQRTANSNMSRKKGVGSQKRGPRGEDDLSVVEEDVSL
jgi:hypothetical protein